MSLVRQLRYEPDEEDRGERLDIGVRRHREQLSLVRHPSRAAPLCARESHVARAN